MFEQYIIYKVYREVTQSIWGRENLQNFLCSPLLVRMWKPSVFGNSSWLGFTQINPSAGLFDSGLT